ncbi:MAG: PQQ-dependent sugar dehydrogenase [Rhizobiales bacterium]|nr:PQQ-dependent sugar dehydrogenase [Hyphomicrobiales bacterium]
MIRSILGLGFLISAATTAASALPTKTFKSEAYEFAVETLTEKLDAPWGFAFLPDESVLITEQDGALLHLKNGVLSAPLAGVPKVKSGGQGGLLDVAIDPDFARNRFVYLTYSEPGKDGAGTALARGVFNGQALEGTTVIFRQNKKTSGGRHFGSRITFAPDGTLFFTIGDRGNRPRAQDPRDHAGSVLRINRDGAVPPDNPFSDGQKALPEIWSIGHRNPQGIDVHPLTGEIWTVSHGARGGDEINKPEAGKNYGWPVISFGRHYSGGKIGEGTAKEGMEQPRHYWDPSIAPSSMTFYFGDLFPKWKGDMFVSALRGQKIVRVDMEGDEIKGEEALLDKEYGRIRRVDAGPDGALYAITDEGSFLRIRPTKLGS